MEETRIIIPYAPRKQFMPFHERKERFAAMPAHRRAGKTVACVNDEIKNALMTPLPNPRTAYIAPYYKQAKTVAWAYAKEYGLSVAGATANESELRINFPNGGQFRLFGADNPDALRGIYLDSATLDENADMKPRLFQEVIRPALVDRKGRATFIGTPKGHNEFYRICQLAKNDPDWFFMELKASQTGLIDPEELAALRRDMTEDQYEQEFECSFDAAILGAYYGQEIKQAEDEGRIISVPYDPNLPVFTAWDLGYSDDTAIWFYQVHRNELRVIDYFSESGQGIDYYVDKLRSLYDKYDILWLPHDAKAKTLAAGGKSIEEQLRRAFPESLIRIVPRLSLQDGIQAARMVFKNVYIEHSLEEGIDALKQYRREWDEDKKRFKDKPLHDWTSHGADAFRYMCIVFREQIGATKPPEPKRDAWGRAKQSSGWKTV